MKIRIIVVFLAFFAILLSAQEGKKHRINSSNDPKVYPITAVDWESCNVKELLEFESRDISFGIKNISDKEVMIHSVKVNCPCLNTKHFITEHKLKPGEVVKVELTVNANRLERIDNYERGAIIEVDDLPLAAMPIMIEMRKSVTFKPAQAIDLEDFICDADWTLTYNVTFDVNSDNINLKVPEAGYELFNMTIDKLGPKEFNINVSPKTLPLPLTKKEMKRRLTILAEGIPNYNFIEILVIGRPCPRIFVLDPKLVVLDKDKETTDKEFVLDFNVKTGIPPLKKKLTRQQKEQLLEKTDMFAFRTIKSGEHSKNKEVAAAAWKQISAGFTFDLPEQIKIDTIINEKGCNLKLTIPPNYFNDKVTEINGMMKYNGKPAYPIKVVFD